MELEKRKHDLQPGNTGGWKYDTSMYIVAKYNPHQILINYKWKNSSDFTLGNPGRECITKWWKLTSPVVGQVDIMFLQIWCTEKHTTALLLYFCRKYIIQGWGCSSVVRRTEPWVKKTLIPRTAKQNKAKQQQETPAKNYNLGVGVYSHW
jgi:hypothetical protein